jgi:hypothetical protein
MKFMKKPSNIIKISGIVPNAIKHIGKDGSGIESLKHSRKSMQKERIPYSILIEMYHGFSKMVTNKTFIFYL